MKPIQSEQNQNATQSHDGSHQRPRALRRTSRLFAALIALGALGACGAPSEFDEDVASRTDYFVGNNGDFKYLGAIQPLATGVGDPSMCTPNGAHSKVIFTRDTSGYVQGEPDVIGIRSPWAKFGGAAATRKFGGRPVCGFLPGTASPYPFILVAKGATAPGGASDKRIYWAKGEWKINQNDGSSSLKALTQWAKIDDTQYSTNGNPVVATYGDQMVMAYLNDSGQIRANYWDAVQGKFSATISGPNLPQGWTGVGSPAIAFAENWAGKYVIFVRAKNAQNQYKLYDTFFANNKFTGAAGGNGSYQEISLPAGAPAMQSDPAYEYDNYEYAGYGTLYYRNGDRIYQVSAPVDAFVNSTVRPLDVANAPKVSGNLSVIGGVPYEAGRHWVLARGKSPDTNIYFGESFNDENLFEN
jgi:hypothetical protein